MDPETTPVVPAAAPVAPASIDIKAAIAEPRSIDENLVHAQQARRVLDRLVGYKISPILWDKVRRGLSAGRVQSVALRFIVDREREIRKFVPQEYWTLDAKLSASDGSEKSKIFLSRVSIFLILYCIWLFIKFKAYLL